jgi:signal transduction histidine kinase
MPADSASPAPPASAELNALLADVQLLRAQHESGTLDPALLTRALDATEAFVHWASQSQRRMGQHERIEMLYRVSQVMGGSLDLQEVLDRVMDAVTELTRAERAFLILRDDDGTVDVQAARNLDRQTLSADHFLYSRSVVDSVLDSGMATVTTNASADPRFRDRSSVVNQMLRFIVAVPLRLRGRIIGVIYADSRTPGVFAGEDTLPMLETFAAQAAVAIDHARMFSTTDAALSARLEELQQLRRIDLQLNASLDEDRALQVTLDWLARMCHAEAGYAAVIDHGDAIIRYRTGAAAFHPVGASLTEVWPQVHDVIGTSRTFCFSYGNLSIALLPIVHEERLLGVVSMRRAADMRGPFSAEEIDLAERILARAAVAIDNARLHTEVIAADRAKTEFVGIVAHDLRAPMGTILAYADLALLTGRLDAEVSDYVERIRDTVYRVDKLVSDLADISRIESGVFLMEEARVHVGRLLAELRDTMQSLISAHHHEWAEIVAPGLPDVRADHFRLLQVLTNLVSNAAKYTPDHGTITISVALVADITPAQVEFTVADTGIGMSGEALAQLGVKFWRSEDDFTRSQPGSGLGFYIAGRLVAQMGGTIRAESTPGAGSRFTFTVPAWQE